MFYRISTLSKSTKSKFFQNLKNEAFNRKPRRRYHRNQRYGHATEARCFHEEFVKCRELYLITVCHHNGYITPKCINCDLGHPAT